MGSFSKCSCSKWRPWANWVSYTSHDAAHQDFVLDFASLIPRWASLPVVQAHSHDDVRLFNDHFFLHFDSVSLTEKIPHLATPVRSQVQLIPWDKMLTCRAKDLRRKQLCNGCSCDTHTSTEGQKQLVSFVCLNRLLIGQVRAQVVDHFISVIQDRVKVRVSLQCRSAVVSSSAWGGSPAPELTAVCVRESLSAICSAMNSVCAPRRLRDAHLQRHPWFALSSVTTSSCVWDTSSLMTLSHLHASSTVGAVLPRLEIGVADIHAVWCKLLLNCGRGGKNFIEAWRRVFPRSRSNAPRDSRHHSTNGRRCTARTAKTSSCTATR